MNNTHKISDFLTFVIIQLLPWGVACLGHYVSSEHGWPASRWLRILFGDFRRQGNLNISSAILQLVVYFFIIILLVYVLTFDPTPGGRAIILLAEYFVGFGLAKLISSKLQKNHFLISNFNRLIFPTILHRWAHQ